MNFTDIRGATGTIIYTDYNLVTLVCNGGKITELSRRLGGRDADFVPPLVDDGERTLAKRGIVVGFLDFDFSGDLQKVLSETEVAFVLPRVTWAMNGSFSPVSRIYTFDGVAFHCDGIVDGESARFDQFAGLITDHTVMLGDYRCADPPSEAVCAKLKTIDPLRNNGKGYVAGMTAENRAVLFRQGDTVKTKGLFPK